MDINDEAVKAVGQNVTVGMILGGLTVFGHWLWKLVWIPGRVRRLETDRVVLFTSMMALIDDRIESARRPAQKKQLTDARQVVIDHLAKIGNRKGG